MFTEITAYAPAMERDIEKVRQALSIQAERFAKATGTKVVSMTDIEAHEVARIGRRWTACVETEKVWNPISIPCNDCGADAGEPCGPDCLAMVN